MCKVSIIIPTYNRAKSLKYALESVIEQTFKDFEVIVIDDNSNDNGETRRVVDSFNNLRFKYYFLEKNQGPAKARNLGVDKSKGDLISFLDSDDLFMPKKLEDHVKILEFYDDVAMVYSDEYILLDKEKHPKLAHKGKTLPSGYIARAFFMNSFIGTNTVTLRKKVFQELSGFDEKLIYNEDDDLWLRIMIKYKVFCSNYPCAIRKLHTNNMSHDRTKMVFYQYKGFIKLFDQQKDFIINNIDIVEKRINKVLYGYIKSCLKKFKIPNRKNMYLYNELIKQCKSIKR